MVISIIVKRPPVTDKKLNVSRRNLPHWQFGGSWYFITFRTRGATLPPSARNIVADVIMFNHRKKYALSTCVIMPDHVHLLLKPLIKIGSPNIGGANFQFAPCADKIVDATYYSLADILKSLKGFAAKKVNELTGQSGFLWQHESFDRIVRDEKEWREKYDYIRNNPVKRELASTPEEYPWLLDCDDFLKSY